MGQLEDMAAFARVVEAGGIGKAAQQMGLAKSAVSRRLMELETRLGVKLLNRTTRSLSLTDTGRIYYARAVKLLEDVDELNGSTIHSHQQLKGEIRLAAPVSFATAHLAEAVGEFMQLHSEVTIHLDLSDRHIDLVEGGIDLAIRIGELSDSSLQARRLCPVSLCLCASPAYLQQAGTPTHLAQLQEHALIHYSREPTLALGAYRRRGQVAQGRSTASSSG